MCGNGTGIPLLLIPSKVFTRVFFNLLTVRITKVITETQSVFISGRRIVEKNYLVSLASNYRIKVWNKIVYIIINDSYKNVRRRGTTRTVCIAAEKHIKHVSIIVECLVQ